MGCTKTLQRAFGCFMTYRQSSFIPINYLFCSFLEKSTSRYLCAVLIGTIFICEGLIVLSQSSVPAAAGSQSEPLVCNADSSSAALSDLSSDNRCVQCSPAFFASQDAKALRAGPADLTVSSASVWGCCTRERSSAHHCQLLPLFCWGQQGRLSFLPALLQTPLHLEQNWAPNSTPLFYRSSFSWAVDTWCIRSCNLGPFFRQSWVYSVNSDMKADKLCR